MNGSLCTMLDIDAQRFADSLANSDLYPSNLVDPATHPHELQDLSSRLGNHEKYLCSARTAEVDLLDCLPSKTSSTPQYVWQYTVASSLSELDEHCQYGGVVAAPVAKFRFVFLRANNSRDRLYITPQMLRRLLTYHQVTAGVLDQLLSYGYREDEQDFSACGFRGEVRLSPKDKGLVLPELDRSGRSFQICYTLRTMERDRSKWKMRQTSTYHSFDVISGNAFWLVLKADDTMRDRIRTATEESDARQMPFLGATAQCLKSAMPLHLIICDWAGENWRGFIGQMEQEVNRLTHKAIAYDIRAPRIAVSRTHTTDVSTQPLPHLSSRAGTFSFNRTGTFSSWLSRRNTGTVQGQTGLQATNRAHTTHVDASDAEESDGDPIEVFSFKNMQTIQAIEERANAALLILRTNVDTLGQLKHFYTSLDQFDGWPHDLNEQCKGQIHHFASRISNIEYDLKLQQARLETLIRLLADRKALLYAVFDYQNALVNKELANRAQESQQQMEDMTRQMNALAEKTQQETVSMRIITLVTLFFLPGTFISTLMSTPIIQYASPDDAELVPSREVFSLQALRLFFKITVPLMLATFLAWYVMYWWNRRRSKSRQADQETGVRGQLESK